MRFVAETGLWRYGPAPAPSPLTAVLEVAGAVLSWTVDGPDIDVHIAFTDVTRADWLWRVVGEDGHTAILAALGDAVPSGERDVPGVDIAPGALSALRRLALGHWMRRWWPASRRDGIAELDPALLGGEMALLTAAADGFFTDVTVDSDVAELLRPLADGSNASVRQTDPRVAQLFAACAELGEDAGVPFGELAETAAQGRRDDYALAAGSDGAPGRGDAIATGAASIKWAAVPPGVFDAAEHTVDWRVESDGALASAVVSAQVSGPGSPEGIPVRIAAGGITGTGSLDAAGAASVALLDEQHGRATEDAAWNQDWRQAAVTVGVDVEESPQTRDRAREFARSRLRRPAGDAFLAEILASEFDY